jgi:nucleoside-diphosphate kinase
MSQHVVFGWTQEELACFEHARKPHNVVMLPGDIHADTLVILKPTALTRDLVHEIMRRLYKVGWVVEARKVSVPKEMWMRHYADLSDKYGADVQSAVCDRMHGCVIVMRMRGRDIVARVRALIGATNPREAAPGTIRADLAWETSYNLIHASAVGESEQELQLWDEVLTAST